MCISRAKSKATKTCSLVLVLCSYIFSESKRRGLCVGPGTASVIAGSIQGAGSCRPRPSLQRKSLKSMSFGTSLLKRMGGLEFFLLLWMILLYMLHSVANNPEEMLHIQISPCFLGMLLSNTEIITVFFYPISFSSVHWFGNHIAYVW